MPASHPAVRPETRVDERGPPGDGEGTGEGEGEGEAERAERGEPGPPAARCRHCDRPFRSEDAWALHVGEVHPGALSDAEREAHEAADESEREALFVYHMKVVVALGLLYSTLVLGYMVLVQTF
jgi:hypothetical protein